MTKKPSPEAIEFINRFKRYPREIQQRVKLEAVAEKYPEINIAKFAERFKLAYGETKAAKWKPLLQAAGEDIKSTVGGIGKLVGLAAESVNPFGRPSAGEELRETIVSTPKAIVESYGELFSSPHETFRERPVTAALDVAALVGPLSAGVKAVKAGVGMRAVKAGAGRAAKAAETAEAVGVTKTPKGKTLGITKTVKTEETVPVSPPAEALTPTKAVKKTAKKTTQKTPTQPTPAAEIPPPEIIAPVKTIKKTTRKDKKLSPKERLGSESGHILNPFTGAETPLLPLPETQSIVREIGNLKIPDKPKDVGWLSVFGSPSNIFGAVPGTTAKYGETAAKAMQTMLITEKDIAVEIGRRTDFTRKVIEKIPKEDFGSAGEKIVEYIQKPEQEILKATDIKQATKDAIVKIKEKFKNDKEEIVRIMRDDLKSTVAKTVEKEYRREAGLKGVRIRKSADKTAESKHLSEINLRTEKKLKELVPDDWGIEDYIPNIHLGDYKIFYKGNYYGSAVTKLNAKAKIMEIATELKNAGEKVDVGDFSVELREFMNPDIVRVSSKRYHKIVGDLSKASRVSRDEVANAIRGIIGTKEGKEKFAFFKQKREGYEGYVKDLPYILRAYDNALVRWKHLTKLNREIQPILQQVRTEGRPGAAKYLEGVFNELWGYQRTSSRLFDASIRKIPYLKDVVRPFALDRWTAIVKNGLTFGLLKTNLKYHVLNAFQTEYLLWPNVTTKDFIEGIKLYRSPEGRTLLEKHGIKYFTGGKIEEGGKGITRPEFRERLGIFAPETYNQEVAWLTMYRVYKRLGFDDADAANHAFLRGNLYTQFATMRTDVPAAFRGPIGSTVFLYRRFPVKTIEMFMNIISDKNYPGVAKFLAVQLAFGGARLFASPIKMLGLSYVSAKIYDEIKKEHGEGLANAVAFGLPGLVGIDLSYSVQLVDMPYGSSVQEKVGNLLTGPVGGMISGAIKAAESTKGYEQSYALERVAENLAERLPVFRSIYDLPKILNENYDMKDPAGRVKFKTDLYGVLVHMLGFRNVEAGINDIFINALTEIKEKRDDYLDEMAQASIAGDFKQVKKLYVKWNEAWPEFPITGRDITDRRNSRLGIIGKTAMERRLAASDAIFRRNPMFRELLIPQGGK